MIEQYRMCIWLLGLALPVLVLGLFAAASPKSAAKQLVSFPRNDVAGCVLCAIGWFWTAYECDTIGIEVFDKFLKAFPGELWILAAVLCVLMCAWMRNLLPLRGLSALCMLFPAELFPAIRLCDTQWRLVLVVFAYACAIFGMFGMFYPWRIRQAFAWISERPALVRNSGILFTAIGVLLTIAVFKTF